MSPRSPQARAREIDYRDTVGYAMDQEAAAIRYDAGHEYDAEEAAIRARDDHEKRYR